MKPDSQTNATVVSDTRGVVLLNNHVKPQHVSRSEEERLAVRLDFDIPEEEKEFLKKRRSVVAKTLQELLGLESLPTSRQVRQRVALSPCTRC